MQWLRSHWRAVLARLPLPMLALAASWGVYSFAALYVPWPIAVIQAAAFELTYIGLAISRDMTDAQRRRATGISIGAVVVSVLYNSIDGFFARNPALLAGLPPWAEAIGAVLHGAPLAVVAYLVADLLLHSDPPPAHRATQAARPMPMPVLPQAHTAAESTAREVVRLPASHADLASMDATPHVCPGCGAALDPARWRAARRWGHCAACKTR